jgi:hypothetical protein
MFKSMIKPLEKNAISLGLLLGVLLPLPIFGLLYGLYELMEMAGWVNPSGFRPLFRERTCSILAIAANAWLLNHYQKKYLNNTVRGLVITITGWIIAWLAIFGKHVL